jgi:hypothetical protein
LIGIKFWFSDNFNGEDYSRYFFKINYTVNGHKFNIFIEIKYLIFSKLRFIERLEPRPFTVYLMRSSPLKLSENQISLPYKFL